MCVKIDKLLDILCVCTAEKHCLYFVQLNCEYFFGMRFYDTLISALFYPCCVFFTSTHFVAHESDLFCLRVLMVHVRTHTRTHSRFYSEFHRIVHLPLIAQCKRNVIEWTHNNESVCLLSCRNEPTQFTLQPSIGK